MVFVFALLIGFVVSLLEALIVWWIGPETGISYFDTATYWNIFFLVLIGNIVAGGASASTNN